MRDKNSGEVARTLYPWGFYRKFPDAGWRDQAKGTMQRQEDPGMADGVFITACGEFPCAAFIEAKTGDRTHFPFDKWTPQQRDFAVACAWVGVPYWVFLTIGERIGGKDYPRRAFLITGLQLAEVIQEALPRKSLSYETALTRFRPEVLDWQGSGTWDIPAFHPFQEIIQGTYRGQNAYRYRKFRPDRSAGSSETGEDRANHAARALTSYGSGLGFQPWYG